MDNRPQLQNDLPLRRKKSGWGWFCLAFSPAALLYVLFKAKLLTDNLVSYIPFGADAIISIYACHQILMLNPKRGRWEAFIGAVFFGFLVSGVNLFLALFAWFVSGPPGHFW